jgi:hypothetical protein
MSWPNSLMLAVDFGVLDEPFLPQGVFLPLPEL